MKDVLINGVKVKSYLFADIIPHNKNLTFWKRYPLYWWAVPYANSEKREKRNAKKRANRHKKRDYYNAYARRWYSEHKLYKKIYSKLYGPRANSLARDRYALKRDLWYP